MLSLRTCWGRRPSRGLPTDRHESVLAPHPRQLPVHRDLLLQLIKLLNRIWCTDSTVACVPVRGRGLNSSASSSASFLFPPMQNICVARAQIVLHIPYNYVWSDGVDCVSGRHGSGSIVGIPSPRRLQSLTNIFQTHMIRAHSHCNRPSLHHNNRRIQLSAVESSPTTSAYSPMKVIVTGPRALQSRSEGNDKTFSHAS